jgi:hypothetical protein
MKQNDEFSLLDYEFFNGKKKLKVTLTRFKDQPKVDIREFYLDKDDGLFKHTTKGVQLDLKKAEALREALEQNAKIIDQHLLGDNLERWAKDIKTIESKADFFSHFEFFKTMSSGSKEEITFNTNHPFGKKLYNIEGKISDNLDAKELMELIKILLISYNHSISQFEEDSKTSIGDFIQDHNQTWATLLKRITPSLQ